MIRTLVALGILVALSGCYAYLPIKYGANQICGASSDRKEELARDFDKATFPHSVRIHCQAQE